jgi:hypothetical protein
VRQRRLRLGQPERHLHGAVQLDGGGQFGTGLFRPADLGIQGTEAAAEMGQERAYAEFRGQSEGLAVVVFGLVALRRMALRCNLTEEA